MSERWPGQEQVKLEALKAKVTRAYPSLVRDVHLTCLLQEAGLQAHYSLRNDRWGADVTVELPAGKVYVHCYVDTARGRAFRQEKNDSHWFRGRHVDLPLREHEARKVGAFWLYSEMHVERIMASAEAGEEG